MRDDRDLLADAITDVLMQASNLRLRGAKVTITLPLQPVAVTADRSIAERVLEGIHAADLILAELETRLYNVSTLGTAGTALALDDVRCARDRLRKTANTLVGAD